ncbi:MAG: aminotransferase class III-fold pyridoxal phosphate-dependent enzyme, partial [Candidatus Anstonellales archaeon]
IFRAYQKKNKTNKYKILCFENSFHGRTYGSLSATYEKIYKDKFKPLLPGFIHVKYNSVEEIEKALKSDKKIGAIMLEPIQGEAGINLPSEDYLKSVSEICTNNDLILIIDEIQTGNGRTGKFFCYQHYNVMPDILVTAKGLANGIPIGVTICSEKLNLNKRDHGSTFGGNSIACIAAIATIEEILRLMPYVKEKGNYFVKKLKEKLEIQNNYVYDVRGKGLMIGATLSKKYQKNVDELYKNCLINKVLVNFCHGKHLRLLPPLSIQLNHIDEGLQKLIKSFSLVKT